MPNLHQIPVGKGATGPNGQWVYYYLQSPKTGNRIVLGLTHNEQQPELYEKVKAAFESGPRVAALSTEEILTLKAVTVKPWQRPRKGKPWGF